MTADATPETKPDHEVRSPAEIFRLLSEKFSGNVVTRALQHRNATKGIRKQLNASVRRLHIDGLRDASRSPHQKARVASAYRKSVWPMARRICSVSVGEHGSGITQETPEKGTHSRP